MKRKRHTRESILEEVKKFAEEKGRPPTSRECHDGLKGDNKVFSFGQRTVRRHFATFNNMLEIAGLPTRATPQPSKKVECEHCGEEFMKTHRELERTEHSFCSRKCSNQYFNAQRKGTHLVERHCAHCGILLTKWGTKYCGLDCSKKAQREARDKHIEKQMAEGKQLDPHTIRSYLLRKRDHRCEDCQNTTWKGEPIPLQVDHIDGNPTNDRLENLRLICPNCHALTPTFGAKNTGNGRAKRRQRYAECKSI